MEKDDSQLLSKPQAEKQKDESMARTVTRKVNAAGVSTLARRLMAIERARALGRKPADAQALALELEARRWTEERAKGKQAVRGTQ